MSYTHYTSYYETTNGITHANSLQYLKYLMRSDERLSCRPSKVFRMSKKKVGGEKEKQDFTKKKLDKENKRSGKRKRMPEREHGSGEKRKTMVWKNLIHM